MDLLSVVEVAQLLGVSARRVRALIAARRIPATRVGARAWAIARADAEAIAKVSRRAGRPRLKSAR